MLIFALAALKSSTLTVLKAQAADKPGDIVVVASYADNFMTLVAAVSAAGLVETHQSKGPVTVFAPTDEAFARLPAEAEVSPPFTADQAVNEPPEMLRMKATHSLAKAWAGV